MRSLLSLSRLPFQATHLTSLSPHCTKDVQGRQMHRQAIRWRKHGFALLVGVLCFISGFSQKRLGLKAGITQSAIAEDLNLPNTRRNWVAGYQVGITAEVPLKGNFSLFSSLQLTQKGFEAIHGFAGVPFYWYRWAKLTYLELPLDIVYTIGSSKTRNLFVGAGLVPGIGVYGSTRYAFTTSDGNGNIYNEEGGSKEAFKLPSRHKDLDLGLNMLAGIRFQKLRLQLAYNFGLTEAFSEAHNRSFSLSMAYLPID